MILIRILLSLSCVLCLRAYSEEVVATPVVSPTAPMTFQSWKGKQILEAQNQVLRSSSKINQLKSRKVSATSKDMVQAERDLTRAREILDTANGLQIADYVSVYLPTLKDQPQSMQQLSERLTKEELTEIVKVLLGYTNPIDSKHNTAILNGLTPPKETTAQ